MSRDEFELIEHFFARRGLRRSDVVVGIGDDAAVLNIPAGSQLVATTDTLVEDVHFLSDVAPEDLGHKVLAVNLSDLAAMGAEPAWATLALTLTRAEEPWLDAFCDGLFGLATEHGMELVGGDVTHGPLALTVQALGLVPEGQALRRGGACPGDGLYVTGTLGDAGLGLALAKGQRSAPTEVAGYLTGRLNRPRPRLQEGRALRGLAHAAIDVSDGLVADLGHLLRASHAGARVEVARLPLSRALRQIETEAPWRLALSAGDDYELAFAMPTDREDTLRAALAELDCPVTRIGTVEETPGLRLVGEDGAPVPVDQAGYRHFQ